MKKIAFANQKGGVGKTTTVLNCGAALALAGKKVLVVDLDPQAHLTICLGLDPKGLVNTIYELFSGEMTVSQALIKLDNYNGKYFILPSGPGLAATDQEFASVPGREHMLKDALEELNEPFDYIFLDCPPSLGILTVNAFVAANEIYIPLQCEFLAMHGMNNLLQVVSIVKERLNPNLEITGIIGTMYDSRKTLNREVLSKIEEHFPGILFNTLIRGNISLAESPSYGKDIFKYKPGSPGAQDYRNLSREIMNRS